MVVEQTVHLREREGLILVSKISKNVGELMGKFTFSIKDYWNYD